MIRLLWLLTTLLLDVDTDTDTDTDTDEGTDDDADTDDGAEGEQIRDPLKKIASLEASIARNARKGRAREREFKAMQDELEQLKNDSDGNKGSGLRVENAFLRHVISTDQKLDLETAWDLFTAKGFADAVKVGDDGTVQGLEDAFDELLDRYPWLGDADAAPTVETQPLAPRIKGGRKHPDPGARGINRSELESRFPSLRRDRH